MRMWMIDPKLLCNVHLLGEHVETHMVRGALAVPEQFASLQGLAAKGFIELTALNRRHAELVIEMAARSMKHNSPMDLVTLEDVLRFANSESGTGFVSPFQSANDLRERCHMCRARMEKLWTPASPLPMGSPLLIQL